MFDAAAHSLIVTLNKTWQVGETVLLGLLRGKALLYLELIIGAKHWSMVELAKLLRWRNGK